jgi:hypothetical protein
LDYREAIPQEQELLIDIVNKAILPRQNAGLTGWSRNHPDNVADGRVRSASTAMFPWTHGAWRAG